MEFEYRRISRLRPSTLVSKLALKVLGIFVWVMLLPLTVFLHLRGYRRVMVFTDRIGHLALEPDCLLKEQALGLIPKRRWFVLAPPGRVSNQHLLQYWKPLIRVFEDPVACFILSSISRFGLMRYDIRHYILAANKAHTAYRIYSQWGKRQPLIKLTPSDEEWSAQVLPRMGLPEGAWFVCVHVREGGFSPIDEEIHAHRNGSIEAVIPAIQEITRRGGWVIRIGDPTMKQLPPLPHVIDYAHHSMKCERLDVILCAKARLLLGNTSGITLVGTLFGVPCALANVIPISTLWFGDSDISIQKLLWSEQHGRLLRFDEAMASPASEYRYAALYQQAGLVVVENSDEEIRDLVIEMFDRLDGKFVVNSEDRDLARHYRSLIHESHCSFHSRASVSTLFLRRHAELLLPK